MMQIHVLQPKSIHTVSFLSCISWDKIFFSHTQGCEFHVEHIVLAHHTVPAADWSCSPVGWHRCVSFSLSMGSGESGGGGGGEQQNFWLNFFNIPFCIVRMPKHKAQIAQESITNPRASRVFKWALDPSRKGLLASRLWCACAHIFVRVAYCR